nr:alpha/beta fold hydrolase [Brucella microti]
MQFAKVNDIVVHYDLRWNGNDKPVLVFINSLGTDFRIWNEVRARLGHDVSTLVYDKRGHGLSDIGKTPYTIELLAQDLIALLDRLSIHKAVICGLSVGGLIAQGLYAARPDLVAGLVLSNTAHKIGTPEMWNARIDAIMQNGLASILDATMPRWFTAAYRRPDNAAYQALLQHVHPSAAGRLCRHLRGPSRCGFHGGSPQNFRAGPVRRRGSGRLDTPHSGTRAGEPHPRRSFLPDRQ